MKFAVLHVKSMAFTLQGGGQYAMVIYSKLMAVTGMFSKPPLSSGTCRLVRQQTYPPAQLLIVVIGGNE